MWVMHNLAWLNKYWALYNVRKLQQQLYSISLWDTLIIYGLHALENDKKQDQTEILEE